ncbi:hypothetical protein VOLCADRAFT_92828 [Volvox carteri f. nagariensis]|uniref:Prolyl endopeptidase n=1 Tax=Volvox carteri f. nagariensis TaxID=3068 RepID=D8U0K3_VOLCA|nr:uncharacterized protein VOLCADRAFT_92828 [Volvox carteri f. nagariensis]EFJ46651.1 hypothetical protein VOLCADRAFT_92828 [Volvox carteri f. nagariensis]|eukprot:XP_002952180.1 hypothetical protein VOLCADRAFT_92828 [Volvox carteri f. nagariensis]
MPGVCAGLRDDDGKNPEVLDYLKAENAYGKTILEGVSKLEKDILRDMDSRVPREESQQGPLSYGPNLKSSEQVVLDVNKLSKGFKYCDVGAVKRWSLVAGFTTSGPYAVPPRHQYTTPLHTHIHTHHIHTLLRDGFAHADGKHGRYVAFSVDTVGNEEYEIVVQEIGSGRRVAFAGAEELSSVVNFGGMPNCAASLEWSADSAAVFALLLGYSALLALTMPLEGPSAPAVAVQPPSRGVPKGVRLYGNDPWVVVAPESDACDILRADHLYGNGDGKETFAVLMDTDKYPDGHVCAVTAGDLKRRTVLVPGKSGCQVVDIAVCGECGSSLKGADAAGAGGAAANGAGHSDSGAAAKGDVKGGRYLVVHMLEDMRADVKVYDLSSVQQWVAVRESDRGRRQQERRRVQRAAAAAAAAVVEKDVDVSGDDEEDDDDYDDEAEEGKEEAPAGLLPLLWTFSPGEAISSLHIDHNCWPGTMPYVRVSYSNLTTPITTVDLDLAAHQHFVREVRTYDRVGLVYAPGDAWPPTTGRPLPCIVQAYGAYGRKLLPDFIPGDLAILDGGGAASPAAAAAAADGCGLCLMVIAHARGGGELGAHWHLQGKKHNKINTAEDIAAVVRMLVEGGYVRPDAVALWGRSAGGLAMGMTLERCPAGTFRTAVLDVPFLDVLGSMMDTSLPLTVKEQPEWGDPASSQEDYDYILSYSPYDMVESLASKTPAVIVTCSLNDPRVPYWGPAKFVARLRAAMAAEAAAAAGAGAAAAVGPVLLLTELDAGGHFAASGASGRLAERAMRVAFMLRELKKGMDATAVPLTPAGQVGR